ncbi:MAG: ribonuclease H family protein [Bacteroidota bacterium]
MALKTKYYVVWIGHNPGIYNSWADCQMQIKNYPGAKYKSFKTKKEAEEAYGSNFHDHYKAKGEEKGKKDLAQFQDEIVLDSIAVDAACSGNPGVMEYRGVITETGEELFRVGPFDQGTNNVGEFLALVHGLAYLNKIGDESKIIYSDSRIAIGWVLKKHCNTKLKRTSKNVKLFQLIERGQQWLKSNKYSNPIYKWETKIWGEIPADFGRK